MEFSIMHHYIVERCMLYQFGDLLCNLETQCSFTPRSLGGGVL